MAYANLGQALMNIGASLPGIVKANREAETSNRLDPLRRMLLSAQANTAKREYETGEENRARELKGQEAIARAVELMAPKPAGPEMPTYEKPEFKAELPSITGQAPAAPGNGRLQSTGPMDNLKLPESLTDKSTPGLSVNEAMQRSGAATFADTPAVKAFADQWKANPSVAAQLGGGGATGARFRAASEEDRVAARATVENLVKSGAIKEDRAAAYRQMAERDPIRLNDLFSSKDLGVSEAVRQYDAITPLATERAGLTGEASQTGSTMGLERLKTPQMDALEGVLEAVDTLDEAQRIYDKGYTGPVSGRTAWIAEKFGTIEAREATFRGTAQRFMNALLKARSGQAVTDQEFERMKTEMFDFNLNPEAYLAKMEQNRKLLKQSYNRKLKVWGASRFNTEGYSEYDKDELPPTTQTSKKKYTITSIRAVK